MQSIIDKLQSPQSFAQSVQELVIALQRTGDPARLSGLRSHLKNLAGIDSSSESIVPTWQECATSLEAVKRVVNGLVDFVAHHGNRKLQDPAHTLHNTKYKISFCRDLSLRGNCPRGSTCTFAHSEDELERYRAKLRKPQARTPTFKESYEHQSSNVEVISPRFNKRPPTHHLGVPSKSNTYPTSPVMTANQVQTIRPQPMMPSNRFGPGYPMQQQQQQHFGPQQSPMNGNRHVQPQQLPQCEYFKGFDTFIFG